MAETREKPVIFSAEMVRAILAGTKIQTRRVVKPQPPEGTTKLFGPELYSPAVEDRDGELRDGPEAFGVYTDDGEWGVKCPYQPGGHLWVRETWCEYGKGKAIYRADYDRFTPISDGIGGPWKPSIFMPRWASRITLEVTHVQVERLREISAVDAIAEVEHRPGHKGLYARYSDDGEWTGQPLKSFMNLWMSINGKKHPWSSNPWVFCYTFRRLEEAGNDV